MVPCPMCFHLFCSPYLHNHYQSKSSHIIINSANLSQDGISILEDINYSYTGTCCYEIWCRIILGTMGSVWVMPGQCIISLSYFVLSIIFILFYLFTFANVTNLDTNSFYCMRISRIRALQSKCVCGVGGVTKEVQNVFYIFQVIRF